jgi:hypothetical protein
MAIRVRGFGLTPVGAMVYTPFHTEMTFFSTAGGLILRKMAHFWIEKMISCPRLQGFISDRE